MKWEHARRYMFVGLCCAFVGVVIVLQMIRLQVSPEADRLRKRAEIYDWTMHTFYPARGQIYDRWGHLLAGNETIYEVGADLYSVVNAETIAFVLSKVLAGHEEYSNDDYYSQVFTLASTEPTTQTVYAVLADYVTQKEVDEIRTWALQYEELYHNRADDPKRPNLKGLIFTPHLQRVYPENELASNVLGFVNRDGIGNFGVEEEYQSLLAGKPQTLWMPSNPELVEDLPEIPDGASLVLTLDREIQAMTEQVLDKAIADTGAVGGAILVMDPRTGEILAMASTPRLNLNEYWKYEEAFPGSTPFNRVVSKDYEPGSVFKVLTMAAALDTGAVTRETTFLDTGSYEKGGYYIHNWNWGAWGMQDMTGCLQHSLNVCLAWVADQLHEDRFYVYMQNFGIGHTTGVDLAGEVSGRLKQPGDADWADVELATNSYGQGVAVTPLQIAAAISAVANDGRMMAPHILKAYVQNGEQYDVDPRLIGTPISSVTARTLSDMLAVSLQEGEASTALLEGYRLAGKTGTADISTGAGGYTGEATNASFVGWGPVDDPRFLVYVWLEKPTTSVWGSVVAAPVFHDVVEQLVLLINLPPDEVRLKMMNGQ